jgi:hypothetical protein
VSFSGTVNPAALAASATEVSEQRTGAAVVALADEDGAEEAVEAGAAGVALPVADAELFGVALAELFGFAGAEVFGFPAADAFGVARSNGCTNPAGPERDAEPAAPAEAEEDGVTDGDGELAAVALPDAPAEGLVEAVDVALGEAVAGAPPLPVVHCWGTAGATRPRKFRTAAAPSLAMSALVPPGTDTTIWSVPWMTTSAPETPVPLTRSAMICLACCMEELLGVDPFGVLAVNVT